MWLQNHSQKILNVLVTVNPLRQCLVFITENGQKPLQSEVWPFNLPLQVQQSHAEPDFDMAALWCLCVPTDKDLMTEVNSLLSCTSQTVSRLTLIWQFFLVLVWETHSWSFCRCFRYILYIWHFVPNKFYYPNCGYNCLMCKESCPWLMIFIHFSSSQHHPHPFWHSVLSLNLTYNLFLLLPRPKVEDNEN